MKFGKQIQRQQLDLPEYAASFLNYKALKKLIKQLSATPTIPPQGIPADAQATLRANKEVFFFRLEREIEKVNVFYLQKEAEFSLRLKTLLDKKRVIQARTSINSRVSSSFATLVEGFQQFDNDLNKLQQFVEVNETAISKILKKWDKTSKSKTKELYLQRAVEIQPCFNRDVLRDLSDRATTARLDLEAWAEGENIQYDASRSNDRAIGQRIGTEESDVDVQILQAAAAVGGNVASLKEWISRLSQTHDARERFTRIFLASISDSTDDALATLLESGLVDIQAEDDINERNCLHEAAIYGKDYVLNYALQNGVDVKRLDVYGRVPLHYACLKGRIGMVEKLIAAGPDIIDLRDHDNFTPLIHGIIRHQIEIVKLLITHNATINPTTEADHIPLNLACQHESLEVATLLLNRGAELLADAEGLYPQHLVARSSQDPTLLLVLKQYGADLNQKDKLYQWTPLFHAASEGRVACLKALLENGADPDALDEKGLKATYYATWEGHLQCMDLLWEQSRSQMPKARASILAPLPNAMDTSPPPLGEIDGIPDLSLPPPIIPLRRYGHNFLDSKSFISINFDRGSHAIKFFNEGRYPAARLTISSKMSDLIPRNLMLPIQDDSGTVSFQVDSLENFAIDFEIFPTFGSKVIAKSVVLPDIFRAKDNSSGQCCLPLFDPRLRAIGQIQFSFQVIKPYSGIPLEITQFATYWKATSAVDDNSALITGSSLSGDYLRLCVQLTRDAVPVVFPSYMVPHSGLDVAVSHLRFESTTSLGIRSNIRGPDTPSSSDTIDISHWRTRLSGSIVALKDVLAALPVEMNLNLHLLYPLPIEEECLGISSSIDINKFADSVLHEVFDHARSLRSQHPELSRSIVFSSWNPHLCTAMNWKQPNYPVLLCNDLGGSQEHLAVMQSNSSVIPVIQSPSIRESAKLAQGNNFMGLMCSSRILQMVPPLVETIKQAGLVLVSDLTDQDLVTQASNDGFTMPDGVNGVMKSNGILRFHESIDM